MSEHPTNEEREAMIAGDRFATLDADERHELAMFADILADTSTWAEPRAGLEDAVVHAVEAAPDAERRRPWRRIAFGLAAAAAILVALTLAALGTFGTSSSPQYQVALGGTTRAPGAHASAGIVHTNAGFHVTLDAHGLPGLPPGEYYQAWLKNDANVLVPIGTFSSGDGRITLWSGVSPRDFPTMTVTIEKADNDQASSGERVLSGVIHPR